jgi:hypothetical protein
MKFAAISARKLAAYASAVRFIGRDMVQSNSISPNVAHSVKCIARSGSGRGSVSLCVGIRHFETAC